LPTGFSGKLAGISGSFFGSFWELIFVSLRVVQFDFE
jgi:hypothetical protein